jgi:hypothetical protein
MTKNKEKRKNIAVELALDFIKEDGTMAEFLALKRRHDVADSVLMAVYDSQH